MLRLIEPRVCQSQKNAGVKKCAGARGHLHMTDESGADLGFDEIEQATDGGEGAAVNLIVIGDEVELFFEGRQDGHDGH